MWLKNHHDLKTLTKSLQLLFLFIFWLGFNLKGQDNTLFNPLKDRLIHFGREFPNELLSSRSVVFVQVPPRPTVFNQRREWKPLAEYTHRAFRALDIDAIAYYYLDDLRAGHEAAKNYTDFLRQREVKNVIFLTAVKLPRDGGTKIHYSVTILPFNGLPSLVDQEQVAWFEQDVTLEEVLRELRRDILNSDLPISNNLIPEFPEFFTTANIIEGNRFEIYNSDLRIDKLGVPLFQKIKMPSNYSSNENNHKTIKYIQQFNLEVDVKNQRLEDIMKGYPFEYYFIESGDGEMEVEKRGYQYILLDLHTTGTSIKEMLGYNMVEGETDYMTVINKGGDISLKKIPINAPVVKYYVKQVLSDDVYLGSEWDADTNWEEALINYIEGLKARVSVRK